MRDDLYGWRHGDLARAAQQVSRALGVQLELRVSSFQAGDYCTWAGEGGAEIIVQYNSRDEGGLFEVPAFPAHSVLLYARCLPDHAFEVLGQLDGIELLQSRSIPDLEF
jgi:hypothetical protein